MMSKKGFTLVEIIVVLVIIAILAAIAIPALTGYINDSRDKALLGDARMVQVAVQSAAALETYKNTYTETITRVFNRITAYGSGIVAVDRMVEDRLVDQMPEGDWAQVTLVDGSITKVVYSSRKSQRTLALVDGKYTMETYQDTPPRIS